MAEGPSSLRLIRETVRKERDAQLRHADALDAKAGIVVGFSGVIVAVTTTQSDSYRFPGLCAAALAALLGLMAFVPRKWPTWDLQGLRDRYGSAHPAFTEPKIIDGEIVMAGRQRDRLDRSAALLKIAVWLLLAAVLLLVSGTIASELGG